MSEPIIVGICYLSDLHYLQSVFLSRRCERLGCEWIGTRQGSAPTPSRPYHYFAFAFAGILILSTGKTKALGGNC